MKPRKNKVIISNEFTFTSILLSIEVNVWLQEKLFFSNYYFLKIKKARSVLLAGLCYCNFVSASTLGSVEGVICFFKNFFHGQLGSRIIFHNSGADRHLNVSGIGLFHFGSNTLRDSYRSLGISMGK